MLFHASVTKWHTVDLLQVTKKPGKWLWFKCDLLYFSKGGKSQQSKVCECFVEPWSLFTPPYVSSCAEGPAVMTSLCCAEHLQPGRGLRQSVACLCRWHLLPWGLGIIFPLFSELLNVNLFVCGFYYVWGCDESGETLGKALQHCIQTYFFVVEGKDGLTWMCL